MNIIADFFNLLTPSLFTNASVLLVACFIIWEIPRSIKIISDEYTKGLYPEGGRVVDFSLFAIGIGAMVYFLIGNDIKVITFIKTPGIISFFLIVSVVAILIIVLGFLKRFFARFEGNSITVFLTQGLLDLAHTIFHISLTLLAIPVAAYLVFGGILH
ncbi:hypothetical protein KKF81_00835 [Candidatus Micrarchaeota archaeon]|nr:hypothetical protein [Candidatus Micrarchaeota archaeon]MBU1165465.1 hypothetical protein [Candidatus Micrarchaeota archaeon]MBU1887446.1 hypothetical protein [Candidatus Micrarchaeota archaeon]